LHELFLLRHADAALDEPDDHERPLSPRGVAEAAAIGEQLRDMGADFGLVICSSALRTRETLKALEDCGALGGGKASPNEVTQIEAGMYLASAREMLGRLRAVPAETQCVLLIAHNPGIYDLATQLAGEGERDAYDLLRAGMPPAALCRLEVAAGWADLAPSGARLASYNFPN
jgi:phosphohistidine phosphatase